MHAHEKIGDPTMFYSRRSKKREISLQYKRVAVCQCPDELFTQTQLQADFLFSFVSSR